jgi:probable rRNA maturation factor
VDPDSKPLRVSVTDGQGRPIRDGGLGRWLESVAPARACGAVAVALATDAHVRALNRQYRRNDRVTDVLSFPANPDPSAFARGRASRLRQERRRTAQQTSPDPRAASSELGDIVIAAGVAKRQARDAGHSEQTELRVLALHGLLHLLGYDHHAPDDEGRMARTEARLRKKGGLRAGLIERARRVAAPRRTLS